MQCKKKSSNQIVNSALQTASFSAISSPSPTAHETMLIHRRRAVLELERKNVKEEFVGNMMVTFPLAAHGHSGLVLLNLMKLFSEGS